MQVCESDVNGALGLLGGFDPLMALRLRAALAKRYGAGGQGEVGELVSDGCALLQEVLRGSGFAELVGGALSDGTKAVRPQLIADDRG